MALYAEIHPLSPPSRGGAGYGPITLLHIAEEIQLGSRGREIRGEDARREHGVGRFSVVDAVPAYISLSRVTGGGATVAARHVQVVVVRRPAAPAACCHRIPETFISKDPIC